MSTSHKLVARRLDSGQETLGCVDPSESIFILSSPLVLETSVGEIPASIGGERTAIGYEKIGIEGNTITAIASTTDKNNLAMTVTDTWSTEGPSRFTVTRSVAVDSAPSYAGLRVGIDVQPCFAEGVRFNDLEYYAPNACYNLNDLNEDGVCDYLDSQTLSYREDRLNSLSVLAYHPKRQLGISLSRADAPQYDCQPQREKGQLAFLQDTDIGALGFRPNSGSPQDAVLTANYPYVERDRCNALLVQERVPWGAFRPVKSGDTFTVSYTIGLYHAQSAHDALWELSRDQFMALKPQPVVLDQSLDEIAQARLGALSKYFMKDSSGGAGFVTNCHPQDGKQLSNVVQYGFTGQNIMNASNLLQASQPGTEGYEQALEVIDFYVRTASRSPLGFTHGLYNMELQRHDSWWTGLLLPLAYAQSTSDLQRLMGPLYEHRKPIIDALAGTHGIYLRCVLEETEALLTLYSVFPGAPASWLGVAKKFGAFLLSAQDPADGSWNRAYSLSGEPLTEPDFWFGQTYYQQRSSTATVVPFLLHLGDITGDASYRAAAVRAGHFVREHFVDKVRHNGGIHDSIYAKPQLIDHESVYFCCRALLALYKSVGGAYFLEGAVRAAKLSATWILMWDIPLDKNSTLARLKFRTTGWAGCDTPGAGYFHPMGLIAVPDLVEIGRLTGDVLFLNIAELALMACNENVGPRWGYAMEGLQEEGVLLAPWFEDDPIFAEDKGFGGRRKGEGNKTCLTWISAVTVWAGQEMSRRFGTHDFEILRKKMVGTNGA